MEKLIEDSVSYHKNDLLDLLQRERNVMCGKKVTTDSAEGEHPEVVLPTCREDVKPLFSLCDERMEA